MTQQEWLYNYFKCNSNEELEARCPVPLKCFSMNMEMTPDITKAVEDVVMLENTLIQWEIDDLLSRKDGRKYSMEEVVDRRNIKIAIDHCYDVVADSVECESCRREHLQLAKWLEQLIKYKEKYGEL